jgi:hypothetical protein
MLSRLFCNAGASDCAIPDRPDDWLTGRQAKAKKAAEPDSPNINGNWSGVLNKRQPITL